MTGVRLVWSLFIAVAVMAVAGCGGSHAASSANATTTAATSPKAEATPATGALPVNDRVLQPSEFQGYVVPRPPPVVRSTAAWAAAAEGLTGSQVAAESPRLRRLGFVAGVAEHLHGVFPVMVEALSLVEQYRSAARARAELAYQYARDRSVAGSPGQKFTRFRVAGIPGAMGWKTSDPSFVGINVLIADGPFYYVVGAGFPPSAHNAPSRAQVITAATALYRRVHGRAAT